MLHRVPAEGCKTTLEFSHGEAGLDNFSQPPLVFFIADGEFAHARVSSTLLAATVLLTVGLRRVFGRRFRVPRACHAKKRTGGVSQQKAARANVNET